MMTRAWITTACWLVSSTAFAGSGESSFTPTSLLVPLQAVRLEGPNVNGAELYRCPAMLDADAGVDVDVDDAGAPLAAADSCLVDLADNAALAALFDHTIDIAPGTYDHVGIYSCNAGTQSYASYVKGSVVLDGTTYYTATGSQVLTRQRSHQGYTRVMYGGCGAGVPLPNSVTVAENDELTVNAFFTLQNIAWAVMNGYGPGGCTSDEAHTQSVCTAYPIPVTYIGSTSPSLQTYYITEDQADMQAAEAGGQLLLLLGPTGNVFGGFSRRLYSPTSVTPSVNYDTPIKSVVDNAPMPGYTITTFGGGGSNGGPAQEFYIRFPAFLTETHDAMFDRPNGQASVAYRAVLQP
ncbi:MAG TPA: hypothetical protein VHZ95_01245 [Polyangiales bacterium]|nr:hypothetical protein [Polyangiales bacterium]